MILFGRKNSAVVKWERLGVLQLALLWMCPQMTLVGLEFGFEQLEGAYYYYI